jgi:hypothetical protein
MWPTTDVKLRDLGLNAVDIVVLACFAATQPLLQVLSRSEALFITHGSHPGDIVLLAVAALVIPAGFLIALESLVAGMAPRALAGVHRAVLSVLLTLAILPVVKRAAPIPGGIAVALALAAGTFFAMQYLRMRTWRWSVVYLFPATLVVPALFLFHSPVSALVFPGRSASAVVTRVGKPAPVVIVVFDEFPLSSLVDQDGRIAAALYPNFAELSRTATWYRNATTVSDGTLIALPAIADGQYPTPERPRLPNASGHPDTIFTLLGGSYRMNVVENNTRLCPEPLCGGSSAPLYRRMEPLVRDAAVLWLYRILPSDLTGSLPDISQSWANFTKRTDDPPTPAAWDRFDRLTSWEDRLRRFRDFQDSIQPSSWPALHFLHILLPHAPWEYLPSGQAYVVADRTIRGVEGTNDRDEDASRWTSDAAAARQSFQRHLLQVGCVDRLVGDLLRHLRDTGLYDSSLIVITADHGTSFRPGDSRRLVTATNHADIMAIPLFVKYPHQRRGGIDDRNAQSIDILPTIAEVLDVKPAKRPDGRSLLEPEAPGARAKKIFSDAGPKFEFSAGLADFYESVKYRLSIFGGSTRDDLYRVGDRYGWTGREAAATAVAPGLRYELEREAYYSKVNPAAPMLAVNVMGRIIRTAPAAEDSGPLPLAVAVNGTVRAATETYRTGGGEMFYAMVPSLSAGRNDIAVFAIRNGGSELARIDHTHPQAYSWGTMLTFGKGGNAGPYYGTGWSGPEDRYTWMDGRAASLFLPAREPGADVLFRAMLSAFTSKGKLKAQHVRLLVNRRQIKEWVLTSEFQECRAVVPQECFAGAGTLEIVFDLPDAAAPISLGVGDDNRTLGAALMWLQLIPQRRASH